MFGIEHKITDSSLYLLHDMLESMLFNTEYEINNIPTDQTQEIQVLKAKVERWKSELFAFENKIAKLRAGYFQFSVEELFYMYGQFDKYISIDFHKFSDSSKKYGRIIGGMIVYGKNERKNLQEIIALGNISRTNGLVKIDVSSTSELSPQNIKDLLETGFKCWDIHKLLVLASPLKNSFSQRGKKEIPNTININININTKGTDLFKLALYNLNMRLDNGGLLIENEWNKYYGYSIHYHPELKKIEILREKLYDKSGRILEKVRFFELVAAYTNSNFTVTEKNEFLGLLRKRKKERFEVLKGELRKSNINSIEIFKTNHPEIYVEIHKTVLAFEDEVLTFSKSLIPVYWDFKSYLHIYLRHCSELQPSGHFKSKTPFAYSQKDIRRILKMAVEKLEDTIQNKLSQGIDFRTYGEKALYFNGNYYSMRIESNGRIDSFYPHDS